MKVKIKDVEQQLIKEFGKDNETEIKEYVNYHIKNYFSRIWPNNEIIVIDKDCVYANDKEVREMFIECEEFIKPIV